jgi:hypothetical protein
MCFRRGSGPTRTLQTAGVSSCREFLCKYITGDGRTQNSESMWRMMDSAQTRSTRVSGIEDDRDRVVCAQEARGYLLLRDGIWIAVSG